MVNWCETTYKCVGSIAEIQELEAMLQRMRKGEGPLLRNGWGNMWLGNLLLLMGLDWEDYRCGGEIGDFERNNECLSLYQCTANQEQEDVRKAIEARFPSVKVYFSDVEATAGRFVTNDRQHRYIKARYVVDSDKCIRYFKGLTDVADYVKWLTKEEVEESFEALQAALDRHAEKENQSDTDYCYYGLHEFAVID